MFSSFRIVNTSSAPFGKDRGTKAFKLYLSLDNVEWTEVLHETLDDPRQMPDPLPLMRYDIPGLATMARFAKFEIVDVWGHGGGLQYFYLTSLSCDDDEYYYDY